MNTTEVGIRKVYTDYVVSDKVRKTIAVGLEDRKQHALYGKVMHINSKVRAHDENEEAGAGDHVHIEECRLLSKGKHYRLIEIVGKAR